ncbi:hypothetical protein [Litoreibacter arenae]|uniref:Uncharacterized protein n=1 Tax=Litoreibacter arenae DSM 19593 TaxID=1123360 RepID=S9QFC2_9RHOB|nr:hypothetical protein [Litoreibacter arenae]EPX80096.1 hypothetical protein thalar_01432 [Litoreibacter arenae DSM 19593]
MIKLIEQMVNFLSAPQVDPIPTSARPMVTRDEVESLFSRELGRKRLH